MAQLLCCKATPLFRKPKKKTTKFITYLNAQQLKRAYQVAERFFRAGTTRVSQCALSFFINNKPRNNYNMNFGLLNVHLNRVLHLRRCKTRQNTRETLEQCVRKPHSLFNEKKNNNKKTTCNQVITFEGKILCSAIWNDESSLSMWYNGKLSAQLIRPMLLLFFSLFLFVVTININESKFERKKKRCKKKKKKSGPLFIQISLRSAAWPSHELHMHIKMRKFRLISSIGQRPWSPHFFF